MSGDHATDLDSFALVTLIGAEPETMAGRAYLYGRQCLIVSSLASVEVVRPVATAGSPIMAKAQALFRIDRRMAAVVLGQKKGFGKL